VRAHAPVVDQEYYEGLWRLAERAVVVPANDQSPLETLERSLADRRGGRGGQRVMSAGLLIAYG